MTVTVTQTLDGFLNNQLIIGQPKLGFRAGHDSVLLAASVPISEHGHALELGSGAGVASLCLAARVQNCHVTGIEIDPDLVTLASENAVRNAMSSRVKFLAGDAIEKTFKRHLFDEVFLNPPFNPSEGQRSPYSGRRLAMVDEGNVLGRWTDRATELVCPGGGITVVMRADRLAQWREGVSGALSVLELLSREGERPKRIIARLTPSKPSSYRLAKPFVLQNPYGKPTDEAEAVLRHSGPLYLE